jgi:hypothetical protein
MFEKTFVDSPIYSDGTSGIKVFERANIRNAELANKRFKTSGYIAATLGLPVSQVKIVEGLDTWESKKGRYFGIAEVVGKSYKFTTQNFPHKENQIIVQVSISEK